jgi:hypothetical protein
MEVLVLEGIEFSLGVLSILSDVLDGLLCCLLFSFQVVDLIVTIEFINPGLGLSQLLEPLNFLLSPWLFDFLLLFPRTLLLLWNFKPHLNCLLGLFVLLYLPLNKQYFLSSLLELLFPFKLILEFLSELVRGFCHFLVFLSLLSNSFLHLCHLVFDLELHGEGHEWELFYCLVEIVTVGH